MFKFKHINFFQKKRNPSAISAVICFILGLCLPFQASSQNKATPTEGLNFNLSSNGVGFEGLSIGLGPRINLPTDALESTLFKLDLTDNSCLSSEESCLSRSDNKGVGYQKAFTSISTKGLDLSLTPRAALRFNDESSSAAVGAMVEIGEDLRKGSNFENNTWYFFAGADAEALSYNPNSVDRLTSGQFHLQDRIIVGDAQAGLGYRTGNTDLSLSYLRRETTSDDYSFNEDAAALSFTWKR